MKPYTKTDRILFNLFPVAIGISLSTVLVTLATTPHWISLALGAIALVVLPFSIRSRLRAPRRYAEIEHAAKERGGGITGDGLLFFTEDEVDEIGLIKGQFMANSIRALSSGVERM